MKKIRLFTLSLFVSSALFAQNNPTIGSQSHAPMRTPMEKKPRFGIDVGVNMARYNEDGEGFTGTAPNTNNKTAFHAGVFVDVPIAGMFSIRPQILYSSQGSKIGTKQTSGNYNFEEDLKYIYVAPAVLQLMTPGGFMVETGPQLGFLIGANADDAPGDWTGSVDLKDRRKKLDFMWGAGLGYMSRIGLGVHARYNYGFSNVLNVDDDANRRPGTFRNRVMQFGLAYAFGAHK